MAVERIGTEGIDLLTIRASELEGSTIDGRGGEDTLELAGGSFLGEFDFRTVASFTGIERIRGITSSLTVILSSEQIQGVKSFENPNGGFFSLRVEGSSVDFRNKSLENGIDLQILTNGATFTVNDLQTAMAVNGLYVDGETLVVEGVTLTDAERRALHSHGINRVQDATGATTEDLIAPSISGLSSRIAVPSGISLYPAAQALISEDIGLYSMSVELRAASFDHERLILDQSGAVRIESDQWVDRITVNGRFIAEAYISYGALRFYFNMEATIEDAREILKSIVYKTASLPMPAWSNKLNIELVDWFHDRVRAEIDIDYANQVPTEILLNDTIIALDTEGGWDAFISAKDPNNGETFTFSLINDANGQFSLRQGVFGASLYLAKPLAAQQTFTITIRVTDHSGLHFDQTFVLSVYKEPDGDLDEQLDEFLEGTDGNDRLTGFNGASLIQAFDGNDLLIGSGGSDTLHGGLGRDTLVGGTGADEFVFDTKISSKRNANIDRIKDFNPKEDAIVLDTYVFKKLMHPGQLSKQAFWSGSKAHDGSDRIIYHKTTGNLFYDPDGTGKTAAIKFAILPSKLKLAYHDFLLI